jgi:hypothetical protein
MAAYLPCPFEMLWLFDVIPDTRICYIHLPGGEDKNSAQSMRCRSESSEMERKKKYGIKSEADANGTKGRF